MEGYLTPAGYGEAEYIDKKSRFIGRVWPVKDEDEALALLGETRKSFADATHNVHAYTLRSGVMRWSDDGEPGGTSGQPTLNVLRSGGVEDALCVVTRYFGGILLGSGGLVRAYSNAARMALEAAGLARMEVWSRLRFDCGYARYERLRRLLDDCGAAEAQADFGESVTVTALLPGDAAGDFSRRLSDMTAGECRAEELGGAFRGVRVT